MKNFKRYRGNFEEALRELANAKPKQRFATPAEAMDERIRQGENADICTSNAWYNASFSEVDGRILGTRGQFNPLVNYAQKAVDSMKNGEFYLNDDILLNGKPAVKVLAEIAAKDSKKPVHKRRVIDLGKAKTHEVPTDSFADDDTIVFLAEGKERANKYGLFLRKSKYNIQNSNVFMQDLSGKNKTRGFWFSRLVGVGGSEFDCYDRNLDSGGGSLFGVSYESAKGTSKKILKPSLREIVKYSKRFVPEAVKDDFEKGLKELLNQSTLASFQTRFTIIIRRLHFWY